MIIQVNKKVNSVSKMIDEYEQQLNVIGVVCPCCKSNDFIYYGSYYRNVVYLENNRIIEKRLGIKRVLCKKCHKTHAIIPSFLVPYKQYGMKLILVLINNLENKEEPEILLEERAKISRQIVSIWKKQYNEYINKICTMYVKFNKKEVLKLIIKEKDIIKKYYDEYLEIFMMKRQNIFYNCIPT